MLELELSQRIINIVSNLESIISGIPEQEILKKSDGRIIFIGKLPFIKHPIYGDSGIKFREVYDTNGSLINYDYSWEKMPPKGRLGKQLRHISAWGMESHDGKNWVESNPYHHHHIPEDRTKRQSCWNIRSLEDVVEFVRKYIEFKIEYTPVET